MISVELDQQEWQQVINILAMANPLLMKIIKQVQEQQQNMPTPPVRTKHNDGAAAKDKQ